MAADAIKCGVVANFLNVGDCARPRGCDAIGRLLERLIERKRDRLGPIVEAEYEEYFEFDDDSAQSRIVGESLEPRPVVCLLSSAPLRLSQEVFIRSKSQGGAFVV